jgi:hydroxymethylglutaryl-CoA reductase (NADPH)
MLENSLFDRSSSIWGSSRRLDLLESSARVAVNEQSGWQWKEYSGEDVSDAKHIALVSLTFPLVSLDTTPVFPITPSAKELPSDDLTTKAYSVPFEDLPGFVNAIKTIPSTQEDATGKGEQKRWVMQTGRRPSGQGFITWIKGGILGVWDLIQV